MINEMSMWGDNKGEIDLTLRINDDQEELSLQMALKYIEKHQDKRVKMIRQCKDFIVADRPRPVDRFYRTDDTFKGSIIKRTDANVIASKHNNHVVGDGLKFKSNEKNGDAASLYNEIRDLGDFSEVENELLMNGARYGVGVVEVLKLEDDRYSLSNISPENAFVIYGNIKNNDPKFAVKYEDNLVSIYSPTLIQTYLRKDSANMGYKEVWSLIENKENKLGVIPIVEHKNDDLYQSDFYGVLDMLDMLDRTLTRLDGVVQKDKNSLLHAYAFGLAEEDNTRRKVGESLEEGIAKNRAILNEKQKSFRYDLLRGVTVASEPKVVEGKVVQPEISYVESNITAQEQESLVKTISSLKKDIYINTHTPYPDETGKAPSGDSLEYQYSQMDQRATEKKRHAAITMKRIIEIIFLDLKNSGKYPNEDEGYRKIEIGFTPGSLSIQKIAFENNLKKISAVPLSMKTKFEMFGFDPELEMERIKDEGNSLYDFDEDLEDSESFNEDMTKAARKSENRRNRNDAGIDDPELRKNLTL